MSIGFSVSLTEEDVQDLIAASGGAGGDMAVGQYRTNVAVNNYPTAWTDVNFETNDVQNKPSVIAKQALTDRFLLGETGVYMVTYCTNVDDNLQGRIRINDTTIPMQSYGSEGSTVDGTDPEVSLTHSFIFTATAGDFITLQQRAESTNENTLSKNGIVTTLMITRMAGPTGAAGPAGPGSSVIVKDEGVTVAGGPHSQLNFVGANVAAVNAGGGQVNVTVTGSTPVFGTEFQKAESLGVSTTNSTSFQTKVTLNTSSLPAGQYRVEFNYGWNHDSAANDFEARIRQNGSNLGEIHRQEPKDSFGTFGSTGTSQRYYVSRARYINLTAGTHTFDIGYRTDDGVDESSIWEASIVLWRVS